MGNICVTKDQYNLSQPQRIHSATISFIKSDSIHDSQFLGYIDFPKLNQLIRQAITGKNQLNLTLQQLSIFYNQITYQINEIETQNSSINKKLSSINTKITNQKSQGYIIFQIQKIELVEKSSKIDVHITTDTKFPTLKKQLQTNHRRINTSSLFLQSLISAQKILIKVNEWMFTLDISEVKNQLMVLQKLSLKDNTELLSFKGSIIVRIQYIERTQEWRILMRDKLSLKQKQISTMIQCIQKLIETNAPNPSQVLLKYLQQSDGDGKVDTLPSSFYQNDFQI